MIKCIFLYVSANQLKSLHIPKIVVSHHPFRAIWGATMGQYHYLSKRYDRSFYSFQTRFCVPRSLQNHFGRKTFKISLKSVSYGDSKKLSYRLHGLVQAVFEEIKMGKKKLTLDEVKSILKIEVDKTVLHIQYIETGTGTTENQVYQSLQHIT